MIELILIVLLILYPVLEGYRETHFYNINRAAKFALKEDDMRLKNINALTFLLFVLLSTFILDPAWIDRMALIAALIFYRWVVLDGILNLNRDLGFWYAGNSGRSFTDTFLHQMPIPLRIVVKIMPALLFLGLYIFFKIA